MRYAVLLLVLLASGDAIAQQECFYKAATCGDRITGAMEDAGCAFSDMPDWHFAMYEMELTAGTEITVNMVSGAFPPRVNVYAPRAWAPTMRIRADGSVAKATVRAERSGTYGFVVTSENKATSGAYFLDFTCEMHCKAPFEIERDVVETYTRKPGEPISMIANVDGSGALRYRWFDTRIPLVTLGTERTFTSPPLYQSTSFAVTVTNACGELTLKPYFVNVATCTPPSITKQPQNVSADFSDRAKFWVEVTGTPPFEYAWYEGPRFDVSRAVRGNAGSSTLDIPRATHDATYWVRVSNGCGTSDSFEAKLDVNGGAPRRRSTRK